MLCQTCGAFNDDEREFCFRCQAKLLVLSGVSSYDDEEIDDYEDEQDVSLDEHLLERVSALEEIVKRSAEMLRVAIDGIHRQERAIFVNQTGLLSLKEILEKSTVVSSDELTELWESKMGEQLLALEIKERFTERRDRILSLFHGEKKDRFLQQIAEAQTLIETFDQARGMKVLEDAFKLDRDNYELSFFLGEMFFNDGDLERAKIYLERTLEVQPDHFDAAVFYGVLLHEQQDLKGAERWLRRAIQISQESFLPYFSLGAIYSLQGKLLRAQKFLQKAIEIEPIPQAHYLLGTIFYERGQLERAIKAFQSAIKLDPDYEEAIYHLGLCYLDRNWNRKAMHCFQDALELNPNKMEYQQAFRIYQEDKEGRHTPVKGEAAGDFKRAGELASQGNYQGALDHYRRAAQLDSQNVNIQIAYALLCSHLDLNREAMAAARKVLKLHPPEMVAAAAYTTLVEALRAEGNLKEANRVLEQMLQRVPLELREVDRLLREGVQPRRDEREPRRGSREREARAQVLAEGAAAVPSRGARLGLLQAPRSVERDRLPHQVRRPRSHRDEPHAPRHGAARGGGEGPRARHLPPRQAVQGPGGRARGEDPRTGALDREAHRPRPREAAEDPGSRQREVGREKGRRSSDFAMSSRA